MQCRRAGRPVGGYAVTWCCNRRDARFIPRASILMSTRTHRRRAAATSRRRTPAAAVLTIIAVLVVAALGLGWWYLASPRADFTPLVGRWVRPDGGYSLAIVNVNRQGNLDAAYFNPRPINVTRAVADRDSTGIIVFVELRDVNYPGCTYRLHYDPATDTLQGIYYQAALRQHFAVFFNRIDAVRP